MIKYVFDDEQPLAFKAAAKADPQRLGEALATIQDAHGGRLEPEHVVDAARPKNSVLHKHFEWDDAAAAEAYRKDQARAIIRVVRVESEDTTEQPRAFWSIADKGGVSYRSLGEVKTSIELQLSLLRQAERDLDAFEKRYRSISGDICDLVREAKERATTRRQELEASSETRAAA